MIARFVRFSTAVVGVLVGVTAGSTSLLAQNSGDTTPANGIRVPVVTVTAPDPVADESGTNTGMFAVQRSGGTNLPLLVFFRLGGAASNGVDYQTLPETVVIPEGAWSVPIVVSPIEDGQDEGNKVETVVLQLMPSPVMSPIPTYVVGTPSSATVTILERPTNVPPAVQILSPAANTVFFAPANILIQAAARDADGAVSTVEFFEGTNSLGVVSNSTSSTSAGAMTALFVLNWTNVPPGAYTLTAKATDDKGATGVSAAVQIFVRQVPAQSVVNILATDPIGTEIPPVPPGMGLPQRFDPAVFTVTRTGETNLALDVYYGIGGTASNGFDYVRLPGSVTIPVGAASADIMIVPLDDNLPEGRETVVLTLVAPICPAIYPPPPSCYLVGPSNQATAYILDDDGTVTNNLPPKVSVVRPANGQVFKAPINVPISVDTVDPDGYVNHVEVYAGTNKIAEATRLFIVPPPAGSRIVYDFVWTNPPPARYTLTAIATDNQGGSSTSSPVWIAVVTNLPPVTNPPPVVTIAATDPIAFEGPVIWSSNMLVGVAASSTACAANGQPPGGVIWRTNVVGTNIMIGTNTATFRVRRTDGTNADLTVYYAISGTASNGVDYQTLPGLVTIPAGLRYADIVLWPLEDSLVEGVETVILTLVPPPADTATSNSPPAYLLGSPRRAAAIIIDNDYPLPCSVRLPDQLFSVNQWATNGCWHRIEVSSDLMTWTPICTNVVIDGAIHFVDPDAQGQVLRYYRAVPEPNPPQEP
jgi:hypothetical protein